MVKKTVVAILAVVLLATVIATAYTYGYSYSPYTPYGYQYQTYQSPYYSYYQYYRPSFGYPYYSSRPAYAYPYYFSPLSSENIYRYGTPSTVAQINYPSTVGGLRGAEGQLCGMVDSVNYGCASGLYCDYNKISTPGIGACSRSTGVGTY